MGDENDLRDPGTLNGWKDVATYLGKSVRAVQRWERDFCLPVHRIRTPTGQVVYAFKAEIDTWRQRLDTRELPPEDTARDDAQVAEAGRDPDIIESPLPRRAARGRYLWIPAAVALVIAVSGFSWLTTRKAGAQPPRAVRYEIAGTSLVALTDDRTAVWSHDFGWRPAELMYNRAARANFASADLDADGHQELLAVLRAPGGNGQISHDTIFCFTDTGALKWTYTPDFKLSFEGQPYDGPWRNYAMIASEGAGRQHVWASFGHHTWWPSFVVELDASGTAIPRYFQSGAIYALAYWSAASGTYLAAGGVDNEYTAASLALLRVGAPPATSPQHAGTGFRCDSCPSDGPAFFALLPRTEMNRLFSGNPYNLATAVAVLGSDLKIGTWEGHGSAVYYLRDDFTFHDNALGDLYWSVHRKFEASGQLHHPPAQCPDLREIRDTLTWTPKGEWQRTPLAFAVPLTPAR